MRYRQGSIGFGPKDGALLEIVGTATRITHTQLFEMASLKYIENVRRVFNWRIERLLQHAMMRKGKVLFRGSDPVYSITRHGIAALASLSIHLVSVYVDSQEEEVQHQLQHAVELNSIHLTLLRSGALTFWTPAKFLQALNMMPPYDYAKCYDAVATLYIDGQRIELGVEYEHTMKRPVDRYTPIKARIEEEKRADAIMFVVPTAPMRSALWSLMCGLRKEIVIVDARDLSSQGMKADVYLNYFTMTLSEAFTKIAQKRRLKTVGSGSLR